MSIQATNWALTQQTVQDPTARHVLLVLANYATADGEAWPPIGALAAQTGLSESTVRRKLDVLVEARVLLRVSGALEAVVNAVGRSRCTLYQIVMEARPE